MDLWEMEVASEVKALYKEKNPTFVDLLKKNPIDLSLLPVPTMRGDYPSIRIPEAGFLRGIERYKFSLIGRLDLLKKNTHATVWVKFPGLGTEYWEEDVLMSIARTVDNPVQVDNSTLCRNTGFYAAVLVDVDFLKPILSKNMIERKGFEFCQEIQLGRTPKIFSHCKVVGHLVSECRDVVKEIEQEKVIQKETDKEPKKKKRNRKKPNKKDQERGWDQNLEGEPLFRIASKLRRLKSKLKEWNIKVFGYSRRHLVELSERVEMLQQKLDNDMHNDNLAGDVADVGQLLKKAYSNDEELWRQKARRLGVDINNIKININKADRKVWKPDLVGKFSVKGAFYVIRNKGQTSWWYKFLFRKTIHPRISMWGWRLCHGKLPSDDNLQKKDPSRSTTAKSCFWELPEKDEVNINMDGAARGNPGKGGIGFIYRDYNGLVLCTLAKGLGLVTNFSAECKAIIQGIESTASFGWLIAWVELIPRLLRKHSTRIKFLGSLKRTGEMQKRI
ncbi:hypothetical protein GIB67_018549 [Kingdonia uniflora]|uniref:RNase H type-1 domain-containing protein n=1 Tax=Kingdonia uniflora TaxID=39325 RepID=A0A7J7LW71_9MAGN|nr:hypothetical protein GIB67_018549 [Kingdonia uniflora]